MDVMSINLSQQSVSNTNNSYRFTSAPNCTFKKGSVNFKEVYYADFETLATPFEQKSCKPTQNYLDYVDRFFHRLITKNGYGYAERGINNILKVLDTHSQNQEYTDFVKDGLKFIKENNNNDNLYSLGYCNCISLGGFSTYYTIHRAFEQAVKPDAKYAEKPEILQEYIKKSREYMNAFTESGVHLYPEGFIK